MMRDTLEDLFGVVFFVGLIALCIGIPYTISYQAARFTCKRTAEVMGVQWQYGAFTDCMVKTAAGRWVPLASLREVAP